MAATGAAGLGVAFMAACGGSDRERRGTIGESKSSLAPRRTHEAGQAGGVMKTYWDADTYLRRAQHAQRHRAFLTTRNSRFVQIAGFMQPTEWEVTGDMAELGSGHPTV